MFNTIMASEVTIIDGSYDFSGGVNSVKVATVQSERNPGGLPRNQVAWANNATFRDGGIYPRAGWHPVGSIVSRGPKYQSGFMYNPGNDADPYLMLSLSGDIYRVDITPSLQVQNLSSVHGQSNNPDRNISYMEQAEQFLVMQSGDGVTLPLFWDGGILRRSNGILSFGYVPPTYTITIKNLTAIPGKTIAANSLSLPVGPFNNFTVQIGPITNNENVPAIGSNLKIEIHGSPYTGVAGDTFGFGSTSNVFVTGHWTVISFDNTPGAEFVIARNDTARPTPSGTSVNRLAAGSSSSALVTIDAQIGPTESLITIPAVGATVVAALKAPYTGAIGDIIGFSNSNDPNSVGQWEVMNYVQTEGIYPEIPASGPMDYYMGRLWYSQGRTYSGGDIVQGSSGTVQYDFTDSVLRVTENPLVVGGDGFTIPEGNEDIRGIEHNAVIDAALGQGRMFIFTRKSIFSLTVPVTRTDWINADSDNQPLQSVVQLANGSVGDRCIVPVNGDLFFQSLEPGIRSITSAVRNFNQPGNTEISSPIRRLLQNNNRALMVHGSGCYFNNRLYQTALPVQTDGGVVHTALASLDFTPISTLANDQQTPIWEGVYEGLNFLQVFTGTFGGVERCFAVVQNQTDLSFELWELTFNSRVEKDDARIEWAVEFPAYTWNMEMELKRLLSGELWFDRLLGTADITIEYRPDGENCWFPWTKFRVCNPKDTCEDPVNPVCYPPTENGPSYRSNISFPKPPVVCTQAMNRPSDIGYQFQVRILVKGYLRIRGLLLHAARMERKLYSNMSC